MMHLAIVDVTNPTYIPMEGHILQEWERGKYLIFWIINEKPTNEA